MSIHYQMQYPQDKLARVTQGKVFDAAVDLCCSLFNFGKWVSVELSAEKKSQLWVLPGSPMALR
jgi:dTDP-4-dehydrorhamnose 3,5-epimerase